MSKYTDVVDDDSHYTMNRRALITGNYMCILKAKQLADSALRLSSSDDPNDHTIALGLYTLAIEEFGKAVVLKEECFVDDDAARQKVPKSIFAGGDAHERKLKKAKEKLPAECQVFTVGTYLPFPSGQPTKVKVGKKGPYVRVAPGVDGYFFTKHPANVNLRMSCFFVDWDETEHNWQYHMRLKKREELQRALTTFKKKLDDYDMVVMIQRRQQEHLRQKEKRQQHL